jgi:hypothetical protein
MTSKNYKVPHHEIFASPPVSLSFLGYNNLLSILFSNILSFCPSLNVKDSFTATLKKG